MKLMKNINTKTYKRKNNNKKIRKNFTGKRVKRKKFEKINENDH